MPDSPELKAKTSKVIHDDADSASPQGQKRQSIERSGPPSKKRKTKEVSSDAESSPLSEAQFDSEAEPQPRKPARAQKAAQPKKSQVASKQQAAKKQTKPSHVSDDSDQHQQSKTADEADESDSELSVLIDEEPKAKRQPKKRGAVPKKQKVSKSAKPTKTSDDSDDGEQSKHDARADVLDKSDSELSVLIDEEPKPKRQPKSKSAKPKTEKTSKPAKTKSTAEDDPDQAEIKRLQQWLIRCGVRKVWGAYLKPYEAPKAKIKHLKEMLADIGMTGRYSMEKANQIKEAREMAADLEAVQEGDQRWGTGGKDSAGESEDDKPKARGRLQRGRAHYDFLSSDGEETS